MKKKIQILGMKLDNYSVRESILLAESYLNGTSLNAIEDISMKMLMEFPKKEERYFRHFKGGTYKYIHSAFDSETQERMVVYQALYGEKSYWVRPEKMFFETIERDGRSFSRFTEIDI